MTKNNVEKKLTRILNINEKIFSQRLKQLGSIVLGIFASFKSLPISRITVVGFFLKPELVQNKSMMVLVLVKATLATI